MDDHRITTFLMFVGAQYGGAEEAVAFCCSLFERSGIERTERWGAGEGAREGALKRTVFVLDGLRFMASESGLGHAFGFVRPIGRLLGPDTREDSGCAA